MKQLKHEAMKRDIQDDIGTASRISKKVGDGLMFAASVSEAAGQPELAVPLAAAGGGTLAAHKRLHDVHKSKLLKRKTSKT